MYYKQINIQKQNDKILFFVFLYDFQGHIELQLNSDHRVSIEYFCFVSLVL